MLVSGFMLIKESFEQLITSTSMTHLVVFVHFIITTTRMNLSETDSGIESGFLNMSLKS